ncbi:MAG: amidohydrolase family protein [Anaerolineae bacterium]|jgi:5-methylthioadenosine/S-adenosylhomocysteine deaminase|nr:amidohydrolase family protein [Anaerolineae bacterium]MBT4311369.1 amidohydrolase family protein [Anaerolineae bacterium]MBT4459573.1 amidohydrolase family protein [Anaerolineae bacterium]MBT4841670.1 amidohydrolase family protein [Anaerolineae bacterium]MBT6060147.1 amidohydrolase family protein [Anaerolineae bacterium]
MKKTDYLFKNAIVLTMDKDLKQYDPGAVAVSGDSIVAVGAEDEILNAYDAAEVIDCGGKVLMPGLVNAHTHVPMTLLRGLADDLRLDVWLMGYMMPVEREFVTPEFVRLGTKLACAELIRSGVTAFADMYYFEDDVAEATAEAGLRALCGQSVMKFPAPDAPSYEDALVYARNFIERWKDHPLIVPAVAPHAPYTCTPEILKACAELANEFDVPLHIHLAETSFEVENMREAEGIPVIPYVKKHHLFEAKVLAAHCVHIDVGEIRTLSNLGAGVAHNPSSNMKLASGVAPVQKMIDENVPVGIGTDGPASNNDLDMFEEIRLAAFIAKGFSGDPTSIPAATALTMGTRLGAEAMHIGNLTGSLQVGKRADLILIDISKSHNAPHFRRDPNNIYVQLVYAAKSTDVTDVMVNGAFVMREKNLLTLDEADLMEKAQVYAEKIDAFLLEREQSLFSKLVALGGSSEEESFEVQTKVKVTEQFDVEAALAASNLEIIRSRRYREYDLYFSFDDPSQGRLRYREDEFIDDEGNVEHVRARLTLIGQARKEEFKDDVLLSRSRYLAPATNSRRFYREYFKPKTEQTIQKERMRWLVEFEGTEFFINFDLFNKPDLGRFLEIKTRTWSRKDAKRKAKMTSELLALLNVEEKAIITDDYIELV